MMCAEIKSWITIGCKYNIGCLFLKVPECLVPESANESLNITMLAETTLLQ